MSTARTPLPPAAPKAVPARPFAFQLPPGRTALVVIDMQRDFIEPGGFGASLGNDVSLVQAAVEPTAALLAAWRERNWPIVHTRESHAADLHDCPPAKRNRGNPGLRIGDAGPMGRLLVRGEPGCEIVPALAPREGETVIDKPGKGAFHATLLNSVLQAAGVTHLVFAGVTTEVCVQTTMREANDRGYDCLLVEEATASYFPHLKAATLEMVTAQGGIVGWVTTLAELLGALPVSLQASIRAATQAPTVLPATPVPPLPGAAPSRKPG
jgi:nicotinamidase-related amidase